MRKPSRISYTTTDMVNKNQEVLRDQLQRHRVTLNKPEDECMELYALAKHHKFTNLLEDYFPKTYMDEQNGHYKVEVVSSLKRMLNIA